MLSYVATKWLALPAALIAASVGAQDLCVDRDLGSHTTDQPMSNYVERITDLQDVDCFLSCSSISYLPQVSAGTAFFEGNGYYEYEDVVGRGNCGVSFGFAGTGYVDIVLGGYFEDFHLTCDCGSNSDVAQTPTNQGGGDSPYCVDIDLGTHTAVFPEHQYKAEITGLEDIECTLSCSDISVVPNVEIFSEGCTGNSCVSSSETINDCGDTKSISGPGKVVVSTGGFFRDLRVQCTCSSITPTSTETSALSPLPNSPASPSPMAPPVTTNPPTALVFDAARDDPNWPGQVLKVGTTNRVMLNIQYDDYPEEISWTLEEYFGNETYDLLFENVTTTALTPMREKKIDAFNWTNDTHWAVVDTFVGTTMEASQLISYPQLGLSSNSLYRLTIQDIAMDGICCNWGAKGWITVTSGDGVLWSLAGDLISREPVVIGLAVNSDGIVVAISENKDTIPSEDGAANPASSPMVLAPTATKQPTTGHSVSVDINPPMEPQSPMPTTQPTLRPTTPQPSPNPTPGPTPSPTTSQPLGSNICLSATRADLDVQVTMTSFVMTTTQFSIDNVQSLVTCQLTDCQNNDSSASIYMIPDGELTFGCDTPVSVPVSNESVQVLVTATLGDGEDILVECICS